MTKTYLLLLAFVATMVCNGNCKPLDIEVKNIYPVYRSQKQLETSNRYENPYKVSDSVTYHRIDIPYNEELTLKNNSKSVINYVPVALTIKKPNTKKWPTDQNGMTPDDLSLYNIYTNNVNPLSPHHVTTPGYDHTFEPLFLTMQGPYHDWSNVYTQPIQVLDRPPPRPPDRPPTHWPIYTPSSVSPALPSYSTASEPASEPTAQTPPTTTTPSTQPPEVTTKKRKSTKCPNVSVTAITSINNSNNMHKEGCQDINIHISSNVNNSNTGVLRPSNDVQTNPSGVLGFFDIVWAILSRVFSFSFLSPISGGLLSPVSAFFAGLSAFVAPWLFPHLLLQSARGNDFERSVGGGAEFTEITSGRYSRGFDKKISSSAVPTSEPTVKSENVSKSNPVLNIESIATVARASSDGAPLPSPTALGQMMDTVSQLVESDIRTPPKLKEIIKEKANELKKEVPGESSTPLPYTFIYDDFGQFEEKHHVTDKTLVMDFSEGKASTDEGVKGIAIPVVMDEDYEFTTPSKKLQKIPEVPKPAKEEKKKTGVTKTQPTTTPSSGLSTWILLSDNKDVTTPSPKKNNKKEDEKKKGVATTTKKPGTTQKATSQANKKVTLKPTKKPETDAPGMSALEALVKNQKKGSTTTSKPKTTEPKKKFSDSVEVAETKDRVNIELSEHTILPNVKTTSEVSTISNKSSAETTTENSVEGTTKKKSSTKKKKKNKNRRKKPADDTGVEAKIPPQAVGSQIYNFLSREIVPTVGLGLIGVALTAGLASFLGYNPFGSLTVPLRRTYDTHHGYSPNYYNYNTDYGDGGQSEEVLFREVLSGMPEDSRYGLTHTDTGYPEAYNRQDQMYTSAAGAVPDKDMGSYDATYPQDYSTGYGTYEPQTEMKEKYPVYTRETGTSFVYPEKTGSEKASKTDDYATQSTGNTYAKTNSDTIERQPEALYRVASESELQYRSGESTIQGVSSQNSWHRIGSPMEPKKPHSMLEPGPRSLDLSKDPGKKRSKRAAESVIQRISRKRIKKENDAENEIDFEDTFNDSKFPDSDAPTTTTTTIETTATTTTTASSVTTEDVKEASPTEPTYDTDDVTATPASGVSVLDVLKRLAQFKLRLGLNFLRTTTDMFSRYLDDIQRRVDESFANTTTTTVQYNRRKTPWSRIFFSRLNDDESRRRKRSVLEDNHLLDALLAAVDSVNERFSTKKDLRLSDKTVLPKKNTPKKGTK